MHWNFLFFFADQIREYGVERFVEKCKQTCVENAKEMSATFEFMGVWMDFEGAYLSVSREYIEGVWWFIKRAQDEGRLYEAEKTMTWDAVNATALAKHELEYHPVRDNAIFVRFAVSSHANEFMVVWTTTPWTIPFNLAVMANPEIEYVRVDLVHDGQPQRWIIAQARVQPFLVGDLKLVEGKPLKDGGLIVAWRGKGKELAGLAYEHPFSKLNPVYSQLKASMPKIHTVVMSSQFVDTETGTGLVHWFAGFSPPPSFSFFLRDFL